MNEEKNKQKLKDLIAGILKKDRLEVCKRNAIDGDSLSQFILGEIYFYGIDTDDEYWKNIDWATALIKYSKKDISNFGFVCYCNRKPDYTEALKWYKMAAQNGNEDAQKRLEEIENGIKRAPVKKITQILRKGS